MEAFQIIMNIIFETAKWLFVFVYLENIVPLYETYRKNTAHVCRIYRLLYDTEVAVKQAKFKDFSEVTDHLGHVDCPEVS